jgi:hypothetical protein
MKLWLDDVREPPGEDWTWVKTVPEAKEILGSQEVSEASLDHDLGEDEPEGRTLVLWMAENDVWPSQEPVVHSGNVVGVRTCAEAGTPGTGRLRGRAWLLRS